MTTSTSGCCDLSGRHGRGVKNKQLHAIRLYDQALPLEALCDCVEKKIEQAVELRVDDMVASDAGNRSTRQSYVDLRGKPLHTSLSL